MRFFTGLVLVSGISAVACSSDFGSTSESLAPGQLCQGQACDAVARGRFDFFDRKLSKKMGTNGRACADCHMESDDFQLSPADAEARYEALQARRQIDPNADDPLFRPIDADDFRTHGDGATDYTNLRVNGLVRITFKLPPTMKLVDPVTQQVTSDTEVDVWRAVPSVYNVKLTGPDPNGPAWFRGPNPRGGYQLDARVATLQEQAQGALFAHAEAQSAASQDFLDDVAAFEEHLFSSDGVRAISNAIDQGQTPPDPDPVLSPLEAQGKQVFQRACATCHGTASQTNPGAPGIFRYANIQTQCPRPVDGINPQTGTPFFPVGYTGTPRWNFAPCSPSLARNVRLYQVTRPNGQVVRRPISDPGRSLLTGFASLGGGPPPLVPPPLDDWGALDVPQLRDLVNTAPYFHNNSAATIDDVLDHYREFFKFVQANSPPPPNLAAPISSDGVHVDRPFTEAERPALKAYLEKL